MKATVGTLLVGVAMVFCLPGFAATGGGRPAFTISVEYPMNVAFADRFEDGLLSDGNPNYVDGVNAFSTLIDNTPPYPDLFSMQAGNLPSLPYHPIRLVIPGQVDQEACAYGKLLVGRDGDFADMPIGSIRSAEGLIECYENANRNNGWNVRFGQCIVIEHPDAETYIFRSEAECMGTLNQVVQRRSSTVGVFEVKYRLDTFKF
jgi:hypothetical protein